MIIFPLIVQLSGVVAPQYVHQQLKWATILRSGTAHLP